ncbi:hypothetical protein ACFOOP_18140 [Marinicaulis aureus]|uniref:DUF1579 domain-containing protein n=1 Tax=Hyphococcus aureus TaxID=2666033 RepID=A0ABW1KXE8_9PROT
MMNRTRTLAILASFSPLLLTFQTPAWAGNGQTSLEAATDKGDVRDPRAGEALAKLDFLVGDWSIKSTYSQADGSTVESQAKMNSRYTMGGFAIEAESIHAFPRDPANNIFVSTHIFMAHPKTERIAAIAINTLGNRKFNDGEFIENDFVVVASGEMFGGSDHLELTRYTNISDSRFETRSEISEDGGATWRDGGYSAVYTRVK